MVTDGFQGRTPLYPGDFGEQSYDDYLCSSDDSGDYLTSPIECAGDSCRIHKEPGNPQCYNLTTGKPLSLKHQADFCGQVSTCLLMLYRLPFINSCFFRLGTQTWCYVDPDNCLAPDLAFSHFFSSVSGGDRVAYSCATLFQVQSM